MAHPFDSKIMTGQELAKSRYGDMPKPKGERIEKEDTDDNWVGAPARQISNTGKVRK